MEWSQWVVYSWNSFIVLLAFALVYIFNKKMKKFGFSIQKNVKLTIVLNLVFFILQIPILITDYFYHEDYTV